MTTIPPLSLAGLATGGYVLRVAHQISTGNARTANSKMQPQYDGRGAYSKMKCKATKVLQEQMPAKTDIPPLKNRLEVSQVQTL
jgi:hypothetical protein